jgi:hypothetical protein
MSKTNQYNTLISAWLREMHMIGSVLYDLELDRTMNKKAKAALTKVYKNRIKRCKYNITRSKNLKKKA